MTQWSMAVIPITRSFERLSAAPRRLVARGVLAEVGHHLFREELHHLQRRLVAATVHAGADDAGLELVGEDLQLVAHGGGAAVDDVALAVGLLEGEVAR